jgi:eukaryotic-like serine/threonine-protein kinase
MRCDRCDAPLEPGALGGLCPVCLLDAALPADEPPAVKGTFNYDLLDEIGRGGMGVVYRAVQRGSQRQVAVKMVLSEHSATPGAMERFRSEVEAVASLDHPHILPVYEAGEIDGMPFYSVKLADGGTLREKIGEYRGRYRDAARLIATIARAVHHAHERGILHRDLKPGNILLHGPADTPFVSDFGLAKWIGRQNRLTIATSALGTPHYIAPEQAAGASEKLTPAADVYSLGAILYELLAGCPPFEGDTALETLRLAAVAAPAPLRNVEPTVPADLELICLKCLAKEPADRYPSAAALADDLERWLEGHTIVARPASPFDQAWRWTKRNRTVAALSAALIIAVATMITLLAYRELEPRRASAQDVPTKSIAVLPFENLTPTPDNAYFAQGIQDEILTRLGRVAELKVISRASTARFASSPRDLPQIARQLGVAHLLEGNIRTAGDAVRVRVQLTNAKTNEQVWSETYDRKAADLFAVETEIAKTVADKLEARLTGAESRALAVRPTENAAAYQLYLKGRFFWNKRTAADLKKAAEHFNEAIALDPKFAIAHAALAETYALTPFFGAGTAREFCPKTKAAAEKALELDPNVAQAYIALGEATRTCDIDLQGAAAAFRRGLELDPNYASGHHWYGIGALTPLGRFAEAEAELKRALELDPLSLAINADLATTYMFARRYDEAIEQYQRTLEMDANFYYARWGLGVVYELKGDCQAALREYEAARRLNDDPWIIALQAHAYSLCHDNVTARRLVDELNEIAKHRPVSAVAHAVARLALDQKEEAIRALEKGFEDREGVELLVVVGVDPYFDPLRGDPRFEALVARVIPPTRETAARRTL